MFDNLKNRIMECADVASGERSASVSPGASPEVSGETVALPDVQRARAPQPRSLAEKARTI